MNSEEITTVLQSLVNSIKYRGVSSTLKALSVPYTETVFSLNDYEERIFQEVEKHFNINKDVLVSARYLHGDIKYAVGMCVFFMTERKHLGEIQRTIFPNKTKVLLSKYRAHIQALSSRSKIGDEKHLYEIRESIKTAISNH